MPYRMASKCYLQVRMALSVELRWCMSRGKSW